MSRSSSRSSSTRYRYACSVPTSVRAWSTIACSTPSRSSRSSSACVCPVQRCELVVAAAQRREVERRLQRRVRLVGERAQHLQPLAGGEQPIFGVVGPEVPAELAGAVVQRHEQPVPVPRPRAAAVPRRRVEAGRRSRERLLGREQVAAAALEAWLEERRDLLDREREVERPAFGAADARARPEDPGVVGDRHDDDAEAERASYCVRDCAEQLVGIAGELVQPRRDVEELREGLTVLRGRRELLRGLDRDGEMGGERGHRLELLVARPEPGHGLVDREDAEHGARAADERDEQRVVGLPRVRVVERQEVRHVRGRVLRVDLLGRHEERAVALEARVEVGVPRLVRRARAEEGGARVVGAVHRDDLEVVPRGAVGVDGDGAVAEDVGDRAGGGVEELLQLRLRAHEARDLEEAGEVRERCDLAHRVRPSSAHAGGS